MNKEKTKNHGVVKVEYVEELGFEVPTLDQPDFDYDYLTALYMDAVRFQGVVLRFKYPEDIDFSVPQADKAGIDWASEIIDYGGEIVYYGGTNLKKLAGIQTLLVCPPFLVPFDCGLKIEDIQFGSKELEDFLKDKTLSFILRGSL